MLINNDTYQRETLSEQPIRQPLKCAGNLMDCSCVPVWLSTVTDNYVTVSSYLKRYFSYISRLKVADILNLFSNKMDLDQVLWNCCI